MVKILDSHEVFKSWRAGKSKDPSRICFGVFVINLLVLLISKAYDLATVVSGVSRVWQVGHVPWAPLEGGANERF